jgi:predicted enzyme related to lactoylglutathione lyase
MEILSSRVVCHTDDIAGLRHFYEEVLGLRIYREYGRQAGQFTGVVYFLGGGFLEITASDRPSPPITLWLQVPKVTDEAARLAAAGVELAKDADRMPWGLIELWIRDPQGNELRIVEVPEDHPLRRRAG